MFFNSAASKQPVAKLANRDPVAARKVAAQIEREWPFLLITGEIRCPSTDVVVAHPGVASKATVILHTRPIRGKKQQAQAAQLSP